MYKNAFTLAETLITLGIIGVIATATLPSLVNNHQKTLYVTQLRKTYSDLNNALERMKTDSRAASIRESRFVRTGGIEEFFGNYLNTEKICKGDGLAECTPTNYKSLSGNSADSLAKRIQDGEICALLKNGTSVCYHKISNGNIYFLVDVNGFKGPNIGGRDFFGFRINNDKLEGVMLSNTTNQVIDDDSDPEYIISHEETTSGYDNTLNRCKADGNIMYFSSYCTAIIMHDNWKMDY